MYDKIDERVEKFGEDVSFCLKVISSLMVHWLFVWQRRLTLHLTGVPCFQMYSIVSNLIMTYKR